MCVYIAGCVCAWSLAYVTHHIDGAQACSRLGLLLGGAERLIVEALLGGEQGGVDQVDHQDGVDHAEETPDLTIIMRRK